MGNYLLYDTLFKQHQSAVIGGFKTAARWVSGLTGRGTRNVFLDGWMGGCVGELGKE